MYYHVLLKKDLNPVTVDNCVHCPAVRSISSELCMILIIVSEYTHIGYGDVTASLHPIHYLLMHFIVSFHNIWLTTSIVILALLALGRNLSSQAQVPSLTKMFCTVASGGGSHRSASTPSLSLTVPLQPCSSKLSETLDGITRALATLVIHLVYCIHIPKSNHPW